MQNPERVGTAYYNRGVGAAVMSMEARKNAQRIHKKVGKTVTGAAEAVAAPRQSIDACQAVGRGPGSRIGA